MPPTERDPLLEDANARNLPGAPGAPALPKDTKYKPGPLEITRSNRYAILAGVWLATFLSSLNTTLVATLLSSISSDFDQANQASWLGTSYLLATSTFTPLYGRLCNAMGRRGANMVAVLFAGLGTIACGFARNMEMLIVARFISGLGGGGIFTTSTIIISDMYSMRSRGLAQGMGSVFNGLGMGLGGPLGGFIADRWGWRWAFLIQAPLFVLSIVITSSNLNYTTPGKSKSTKDILKRIDYGGTITLFASVLSMLIFLSTKYNDERSWSDPAVILPLAFSGGIFILFVIIELKLTPEPVLAPFLLKEKIPVLVGVNNFLVAMCNFAVQYFFPMWFETVALESASMAGLHIFPNSISMSCGSVFAGWMMHVTGKYKMINLIFGIFPFIAATLLSFMREDSGPIQKWISIIPLGFGNAVVLQTTLIALLAHLPHSHMAVGTGFGQLFRGVGQVGGVAVSSAIFQSILVRELRKRFTDDGDEELIRKIRHSSRLVAHLEPAHQRKARDSYALAIRAVFILAACSTFCAYLVRLPIPEKSLDKERDDSPQQRPSGDVEAAGGQGPVVNGDEPEDDEDSSPERDPVPPIRPSPRPRRRRLSTYESVDSGVNLEDDRIGGSARTPPTRL